MADINKFHRSKDRIKEVINYLLQKTSRDEDTDLHISNLQASLQVIDDKMNEFERKSSNNSNNNY